MVTTDRVQNDSGAQLQWLVDRAELSDLATAYCWYLDTRDCDRWADLFVPEGGIVFPFGKVRQPRMAEFVKAFLVDYPVTSHLIGNFWCDIDGDSAQLRVYLRAVHLPDPKELARRSDVDGMYVSEARRVNGDWKFVRVEASVTATDGEAFQSSADWAFDESLEYESA